MNVPAEFSVGAFLLSFAGGFLTGLNPCCYSAVPGALGYMGGFCRPSTKQCVWLSIWMGLGIFTANMIFGILVIYAGTVFGEILPSVRYVLALIPVVMGLVLLEAIPLKFAALGTTTTTSSSSGVPKRAIGSYLIGMTFSLAVLPCATPALATILSFATIHGQTIAGTALVAAYGAGISIPVVFAGSVFGFVSSFSSISRHWPVVSRVSGILLIGLGLYFLWKA